MDRLVHLDTKAIRDRGIKVILVRVGREYRDSWVHLDLKDFKDFKDLDSREFRVRSVCSVHKARSAILVL